MARTATYQPTILLVGNTNVGKSTLFNGVTGAHQAMVNAPGTTVEMLAGTWKKLGARIIDLPGTYSLIPQSPDEEVVARIVAATHGEHIDLILAVLDGSSLTRSLYLLGQLGQTGHPVAALISMADVAKNNGVDIDAGALASTLGIPVMTFDARKSKQYETLDTFVANALESSPYLRGIEPDPSAPGFCEAAARRRAEKQHCAPGDSRNLLAQTTCGCERDLGKDNCCQVEPELDSSCKCGGQRASSLDLDSLNSTTEDYDPHSEAELKRATALFSWVERVEAGVSTSTVEPGTLSRSDKIDRILLNPFAGPIVFFAVMWVLFKLAADWIGPAQDFFDQLMSSTDDGAISLARGIEWALGLVGLHETWVNSLLVNGLATGLGVVASFVPLMFVIFAAISTLEDCGYLARAAFLADRLMRKIGLDGRVVLPLIMGFGCNLPSLAAARALPSAAQRLVTAIITPYTSCAARLTIYLMIAKIFFPGSAGTVVFGLYVVSIVMIILAAWVLKFFFTKNEAEAPLMLILPAYQTPRILVLLKLAAQRSWTFVKGAGRIIVTMTMVVWLLGAIPVGAGTDEGFASPDLAMEDSAYGQVAKVLEPVFTPAGFGDWHMTGALMTGFVAKETVVSSIVVSYNMDPEAAGDAEENGDDLGVLPELLSETFTTTAGAQYAGLAALAFLVFVLTYTPCLATVGEQVRLIGGKITAIAVAAQLVIAWILAVGVFQIGKLFF